MGIQLTPGIASAVVGRSPRFSLFSGYLVPGMSFVGRFMLLLEGIPILVLLALTPLSALLLLLPAFLPQESVIADEASRDEDAGRLASRAFALAVGLAAMIAVVVGAYEFTYWLGLTGVLRGLTWVVLVFFLDFAVLAAVGRVPLRYNIRNLAVRWRITVLTGVAFTVVVALLTVMLAFVNGMYRVTTESGQPANVLILADGSTDEIFSNLSYSDVDLIETERCTLDPEGMPLASPVAIKRAEIKGRVVRLASKETYAIAVQTLPDQGKKRFVQIRGIVDPELAGIVHDLTLSSGRWFSEAGVQTPAGAKPGERDQVEVVMGAGAAREFGTTAGKPTLAVGDTFQLSDRTWVVVGIMNSDGTTFGSELWARQNSVAKLFNKNGYNSMVIRVDGDGPRDVLNARADAMAHHLRERFSNPKVNAQTETAYFEKQTETNKQFLYAIIFVAAVMAVGGVFGVMNTMFAAIAARTKDIGVMRIIGFKRWQVLVSFLLESLFIAVLGGALGCLIGSLAHGLSATSTISSGQGGGKTVILRLAVDAKVLMTGALFTLLMGRLGGLIPALSALRMKALELVR